MNSSARQRHNFDDCRTGRDPRSGQDRQVIAARGSRKYLLLLQPEFDFHSSTQSFPPLRCSTDAVTAVLVPRVLCQLSELQETARARTRKSPIIVRKRLFRHLAREIGCQPFEIARLFRALYPGHAEIVRKLALKLGISNPGSSGYGSERGEKATIDFLGTRRIS